MSRVQYVRGFPFSKAPWYTQENLEATLDYVPRDGDILIITAPKTGSTWLQYIVLQIVSKGEMFPSFNDALLKNIPLLELVGPSFVDAMEPPRAYRTHVPYGKMQKNSKAKYLYIYRNPDDQFLSVYKFFFKIRPNQVYYPTFLEEYLSGEFEYGNYFDHILSTLAHKDDENLLMISYEKMHANRKEWILKIAKFLGEEYYQSLSEDPKLLDGILERTSFQYMQENLPFEHPFFKMERSPSDDSENIFFRKGLVGEGKITLSPDDRKRIRDLAAEKLKGTDVLKEWTRLWEEIA